MLLVLRSMEQASDSQQGDRPQSSTCLELTSVNP